MTSTYLYAFHTTFFKLHYLHLFWDRLISLRLGCALELHPVFQFLLGLCLLLELLLLSHSLCLILSFLHLSRSWMSSFEVSAEWFCQKFHQKIMNITHQVCRCRVGSKEKLGGVVNYCIHLHQRWTSLRAAQAGCYKLWRVALFYIIVVIVLGIIDNGSSFIKGFSSLAWLRHLCPKNDNVSTYLCVGNSQNDLFCCISNKIRLLCLCSSQEHKEVYSTGFTPMVETVRSDDRPYKYLQAYLPMRWTVIHSCSLQPGCLHKLYRELLLKNAFPFSNNDSLLGGLGRPL